MQTIIETEVSYDQVFAMAKKLPLREQSILRDSLALIVGNANETSPCFDTPEQLKERYRRNHEALEAAINMKQTTETLQEHLQRLANLMVATEEDIESKPF